MIRKIIQEVGYMNHLFLRESSPNVKIKLFVGFEFLFSCSVTIDKLFILEDSVNLTCKNLYTLVLRHKFTKN